MLSDYEALLAATLASPGDDSPRLILADCAQEAGDCEFGEWLRHKNARGWTRGYVLFRTAFSCEDYRAWMRSSAALSALFSDAAMRDAAEQVRVAVFDRAERNMLAAHDGRVRRERQRAH